MQPKLPHPGGRPKENANYIQVTFKVDAETDAMLDDICEYVNASAKAIGNMVNGGKSQVLRKLIFDAHAALPASAKGKSKAPKVG
jgi:hypothetical protein